MRKITLITAAITMMSTMSAPVQAGGGGGFAGATEVTQLMNNVELAGMYAQEVINYQNMLMQYETMLRNLAQNPLGVLAPDLNEMVQRQAKLLSMGKDIASSMARIDQNFADTFNNPSARTFAQKFKRLADSSTDALKSAMHNAALHRENFQSDGQALQALVDRVKASDGSVGALQALGSLNAAQIQESIKLRDLISQQQVATSTYMAAQIARDQATKEAQTVRFKGTPLPDPKTQTPWKF